ncbi:MAG: hypothetical protein HRT44_13470 [Bdellovibrionales bacterium]|nr:hypothetical protein [Bdellovibrionales bacterium]NQZ20248.1 hypothetical protein [Bdellovibrionales bacterium]
MKTPPYIFLLLIILCGCSPKVDSLPNENNIPVVNNNPEDLNRENLHIGKTIVTPLDDLYLSPDFDLSSSVTLNFKIQAPKNKYFVRICVNKDKDFTTSNCILKATFENGNFYESIKIASSTKTYKIEIYNLNDINDIHVYQWSSQQDPNTLEIEIE